MWRVGESGLARGGAWQSLTARGGAWRRVECVFVRQNLQAARGGACEAVSGRSWLGFAWDWLFCCFMPLLSQLN